MGLRSVNAFRTYAASLPAVTLHEQWGGHVAKVGGKVFALIADDGEHLTFKVTELSFDVVTSLEGVAQAPYFAKRSWVGVSGDAALTDRELKAYIKASYEMIASKLTRKLRRELGLD